MMESESRKPEGKRRPVTEGKLDRDIEPGKRLPSGHGDDAVDGQQGVKFKGAAITGEVTAKIESMGEDTPAGGPPGKIPASSKPGSAKSLQSSVVKAGSSVGGGDISGMEVDESHVSSQKGQGQGQSQAGSFIGERSFEAKSDVGTKSGAVESLVDQDGRKSALSTEGSEDSKTAFRLSLLSKQVNKDGSTLVQ